MRDGQPAPNQPLDSNTRQPAAVIEFPSQGPDARTTALLLEASTEDLLSDVGRAMLLARALESWAYYQPDLRRWVVWDQDLGRWRDSQHEPHLPRDLAQRFLLRVCEIGDQRRMPLRSGSDSLLSAKAIGNLVRTLEHQPPLIKLSSQFDSNPYYLGVGNGVVDLRTGALLPPSRSHLVTLHTDTPYIGRRSHSTYWDRLLLDVTGDDAAYRHFLRDYFGSLLVGQNRMERFTLLHGPSGTGKSTFTGAIKSVLGPHAVTLPPDTLRANKSGVREDLARLANRRVVFSHEQASGKLDMSLIKTLSGQDELSARNLYQGSRDITPTWSLVINCNDWPELNQDPDSGYWRRVLVVPFDRRPPVRDESLKEALRQPEEQSAILAWLIRGARSYFRAERGGHSLKLAQAVRRATSSYRLSTDHFSQFLNECVRTKKDSHVTSTAFFWHYQEWCAQHGIEDPPHMTEDETVEQDSRLPKFNPQHYLVTSARC